jgi:hypothetical protein
MPSKYVFTDKYSESSRNTSEEVSLISSSVIDVLDKLRSIRYLLEPNSSEIMLFLTMSVAVLVVGTEQDLPQPS